MWLLYTVSLLQTVIFTLLVVGPKEWQNLSISWLVLTVTLMLNNKPSSTLDNMRTCTRSCLYYIGCLHIWMFFLHVRLLHTVVRNVRLHDDLSTQTLVEVGRSRNICHTDPCTLSQPPRCRKYNLSFFIYIRKELWEVPLLLCMKEDSSWTSAPMVIPLP